jgi:membrane-associated phospholipid phosphatase
VPRRSISLLIAGSACAAGAALVWVAVAMSTQARWLDVAAEHGFLGLRASRLAPFAETFSRTVGPVTLVVGGVLFVAIALARRRPRIAAAVAVILIGANVTTQVLKPALAIPRFSEWLGTAQITPGSWPSGHSTAAMSLVLCAVLVASPRLRPTVAAVGAVFAVAIGYALVGMGWHYPSDVLGGFLVAGAWALVAAAAVRAADARWSQGAGREAALKLRDALTPPAIAGAAAAAVVGAVALAKPRPVLGYMAAHPAALTGALTIAALGTAIATGLALVLRR